MWPFNRDRSLEIMFLRTIIKNQEKIMIDTSKILAAVAAEKTKVDSLIALANGQTATMKNLSTQLAAAIAANDPAALAQVQADLDQAAADLSAETEAVSAAVDANTPPAAPAAADSSAPTA
jgi:ABC-type transporter Mla subunit MlaD